MTPISLITPAIEWNIDTQASSGMAPKAAGLTLYFGQDLSDADVTKVFRQWTDDRSGPMQASASYDECETVPVVSPIAGQPLLNPALPSRHGETTPITPGRRSCVGGDRRQDVVLLYR